MAYAQDERCFRESTVEMLEEEGFKVLIVASDGRELLELTQLSEQKPDIFLTDLNMPNMNRIQATAEIIKRWPSAKIVILSSEIDEFYIREAIKAVASAFLHKISNYKDITPSLINLFKTGVTSLGI
ncbi:response regulator [Pedobacter jamesrossensis]|uniref:Response regulator transcription factor n=1 Tax=Pedobacter jamesrossensis TaxID=1908238 RepID=A0ABV8NMC8_9SPHI